jgi:MFS family permease
MSVIVVLHNVVFYMIGSWLTLATSYMPNSGQWRVPFALQLFPACFLGLLVFTPESPRWLVLRGRDDEAIESLRRYLGKGLDSNDPLVQDEYRSIKAAVMIERQANVSLKEVVLCRDRSSHLKRMLLGMGGQFMQQLGGINALNYYFSIILKENLGMSDLMARILTGANATSYCISTAMAFWIIDRRGRRFLMLTGLVLQGAAYVMVAVAVAKLSSAPQQVNCNNSGWTYTHTDTLHSGVPLPSLSFSPTTPLLVAHGYDSCGNCERENNH